MSWEAAIAQGEAVGIARSELFPILSAVAISGVQRYEVPFGLRFYRQTVPALQASLDLSYTIFDFGARRGRIDAERARLLAANFAFNDVHRNLIFQVQKAYYQLLNASGQEAAARASLANAQQVQQAAEARLQNGLATLPDVLEARSATAQAQYDLQINSGRGAKSSAAIWAPLWPSRGHCDSHSAAGRDSNPRIDRRDGGTGDQRALEQRPADFKAEAANVRAANAERQQARAAFYPDLKLQGKPAESLYPSSKPSVGTHGRLSGRMALTLNWTVFDGGARRSRLAQAEADVHESEARVSCVPTAWRRGLGGLCKLRPRGFSAA